MTYDYGVWIVLRVLGLAFVFVSFLLFLSFLHRTVWTLGVQDTYMFCVSWFVISGSVSLEQGDQDFSLHSVYRSMGMAFSETICRCGCEIGKV
jgi:hypothetical protein